jgi:hypothetical protein
VAYYLGQTNNLGITDNIVRLLRRTDAPMSAAEIAKSIPMPKGWYYEKLWRTVKSLLVQELQPGRPGRWTRVGRAQYVACKFETWVKLNIEIQHQKTGAILRVVGKPNRSGSESTLDNWVVYNESSKLKWVLRGEDIRRDWAQLR